jgi:hypothetical protein
VAQHHFGFPIVKVSIRAQEDGSAGMAAAQLPDNFTLQRRGAIYEGTTERAEYFSHRIMISLAGEVSQKEYCLESFHPHNSFTDRLCVKAYIKQVVTIPYPNEREQMVEELFEKTRALLAMPKYVAAIHAIAQALMEYKELNGDQAIKIIREAIKAARAG